MFYDTIRVSIAMGKHEPNIDLCPYPYIRTVIRTIESTIFKINIIGIICLINPSKSIRFCRKAAAPSHTRLICQTIKRTIRPFLAIH